MTNRSENIKALMTFVGLTIVLTTIGSIIMDKKFEEDQKNLKIDITTKQIKRLMFGIVC